jgi:methylthioribose-1-phosphate isomerase
MLQAIKYQSSFVDILDQRALPFEESWIRCSSAEEVAVTIETLAVRGAPAIGCAAAFGIAVEALRLKDLPFDKFIHDIRMAISRLAATRPTAVNLFYALNAMESVLPADQSELGNLVKDIERQAVRLFEDDLSTCMAIGRHGASEFSEPVRILTHCNTGSLATAGYGTALGVIRALHEKGLVKHVFVDETRPVLQGSRLTAYELAFEGIPFSIITDSMAGYVMAQNMIDFAIVGADRIAANGDVANKIGTYSVAVLAHVHKIPFYVAAPHSTFDVTLADGTEIPVEERSGKEITAPRGLPLTVEHYPTYNPAFDITPNRYVSGIVTEAGILRAPYNASIAKALQS